ncbi:MAG: Ku protein [Acidobacteria bacterium]|nr:MAG: Ku protein [Acidobacteriota bacterium]
MATSVWKGYLSFGLISVPVRLFSAARSEHIALNQLHQECKSRIRQPLYCPTCQRMVERSEIVKGYEYEKEQYVLVEDEDVKKIAPPSASTMEIQAFVKLSDVDPLYMDASYYMVPEDAGRKAYQLLVKTMEESGRAAIAKLAMHQREYTVLVRPREHGLTLHTLYFADEVRSLPEYGQKDQVQVKPEEIKLAKQLVESLAGEFEPQKYHDEYRERLKALIDAKLQGQEVAVSPQPQLAPVIDMMEALKKSLAARPAPPGKPSARVEASDADKAAAVTKAPGEKRGRKKAVG